MNPNFQVGYPGTNDQIYSVYGQLDVSAFGFGVYVCRLKKLSDEASFRFTNLTHALMFCDIVRINPYTNGTERPIYCVGDRGGRMFLDNWSVFKDGVSFYGALLPNESNICPECFPRCDVFGDGWLLLAENWTTANMSYTRDNDSMDENVHMISTVPSTAPVYHVNVTNNTFSGGNLMPYTFQRMLNFIMDIDEQTYNADNRQRGGRKAPKLNQQPNSVVIIRDNVFTVRILCPIIRSGETPPSPQKALRRQWPSSWPSLPSSRASPHRSWC